ncbi:sigma-70 family RNA polymerase sigma factor [Chondromyces crocatus]|uniref:RNA polymerase sigma factor 70 region 4 type 2 domain-containing protein n=1 Tax=Chondromyces crocatus TaxID=52 RepID=A0A0K1EC63_CHOCO|nr:sigma-70 family RNA polymerase sigma factor [Chondromyces crocatus]AKT38267.1 uncharacterized protein CMC5_024100 [Chondromyces crocatus]
MLLQVMPTIRSVLHRYGVAPQRIDDAAQDILFAAWRGVASDVFVVEHGGDVDLALRRWMHGIAWRQASHYRSAAYLRREVPSGLAADFADQPVSFPVDEQMQARLLLESLAEHPPLQRDVAALIAVGMTRPEVAAKLGISVGVVGERLREVRQRLTKSLRRRGRTGW